MILSKKRNLLINLLESDQIDCVLPFLVLFGRNKSTSKLVEEEEKGIWAVLLLLRLIDSGQWVRIRIAFQSEI